MNEYLEIINDPDLDISSQIGPQINQNNFLKNSLIGQTVSLMVFIIQAFVNFVRKLKTQISAYFKKKKDARNENNANIAANSMDIFAKTIKEAMKFFEKNSAHIEILKNEEVQKVYFILNPFCKFLPNVKISIFF